ncbi:MAG: inositol monophosphatase family protein [Candidatus Shapirobacteria bacterium]|jgi:3'-phosphoadenosine 5'-phosphosulfate (PAPS) 3'-phosphatase
MIVEASDELLDFTLNTPISAEHKADKSVVTHCDKQIENRLVKIAQSNNLQVVPEEGDKVLEIVKSGNYLTIDPIDGTLGYLEYVNKAIDKGDITDFLKEDLGAASDFCLLLGLVENGIPTFGACYNFITKEKILIDGNNPDNLIRENNTRGYSQEYAIYVDQRPGDFIERELINMSGVSIIKQAALGLKSLYTVINPHKSAITVHRVQIAGLWDIIPAAVACRAFGGKVYDDKGEELKLQDYIALPGTGATIIKGDKFNFVLDLLKKPRQ